MGFKSNTGGGGTNTQNGFKIHPDMPNHPWNTIRETVLMSFIFFFKTLFIFGVFLVCNKTERERERGGKREVQRFPVYIKKSYEFRF